MTIQLAKRLKSVKPSPTLSLNAKARALAAKGADVLSFAAGEPDFDTPAHIKDAIKGSGKIVPAGEGDGQLGPILMDAWEGGYRGFLSLEPHLKVAGHSHGETGPELFATAVNALKELCRKNGIPLASA